jgi:phosphotransferase system  glucose/maltose/N-acetylglucosamine-specific IIC component
MAILVCATLILLVLPEVTHAATKPSSRTSDFLNESSCLISAVFSFISQSLSPFGYDLALFYSLSSYTPIVPDKDNDYDVKGKKKGKAKSNGNSTSQKKPEDKDK